MLAAIGKCVIILFATFLGIAATLLLHQIWSGYPLSTFLGGWFGCAAFYELFSKSTWYGRSLNDK